MKRLSIVWHLVILLVISGFLPIIMLGTVSTNIASTNVEKANLNKVETTAQSVSDLLELRLDGVLNTLDALAVQPKLMLMLDDLKSDQVIDDMSNKFSVELNLENTYKKQKKLWYNLQLFDLSHDLVIELDNKAIFVELPNDMDTFLSERDDEKKYLIGKVVFWKDQPVFPVFYAIDSLSDRLGYFVVFVDFNEFSSVIDEMMALQVQVTQGEQSLINNGIKRLNDAYYKRNEVCVVSVKEIDNLNMNVVSTMLASEMSSSKEQLSWLMIVLVGVAVIISSLCVLLFTLTLRRGVKQLLNGFENIQHDEIDAKHAPNKEFRLLVESYNRLALQLVASRKRIATSGKNVLDKSIELESDVERASNDMEEIHLMMKDIDETTSTQKAIALSLTVVNNETFESISRLTTANDVANQSLASTRRAIRESEDQMNELKRLAIQFSDFYEGVISDVESLKYVMSNIKTISDQIKDLAKQSNLLAINASIEAARSSEASGFSVVASEMRHLSDVTSKDVSNIQDILDDANRKMEAFHQLIDGNVEAFRHQMDAIKLAEDKLGKISEAERVLVRQMGLMEEDMVEMLQTYEGIKRDVSLSTDYVDLVKVRVESIVKVSNHQERVIKRLENEIKELSALSVTMRKSIQE